MNNIRLTIITIVLSILCPLFFILTHPDKVIIFGVDVIEVIYQKDTTEVKHKVAVKDKDTKKVVQDLKNKSSSKFKLEKYREVDGNGDEIFFYKVLKDNIPIKIYVAWPISNVNDEAIYNKDTVEEYLKYLKKESDIPITVVRDGENYYYCIIDKEGHPTNIEDSIEEVIHKYNSKIKTIVKVE